MSQLSTFVFDFFYAKSKFFSGLSFDVAFHVLTHVYVEIGLVRLTVSHAPTVRNADLTGVWVLA